VSPAAPVSAAVAARTIALDLGGPVYPPPDEARASAARVLVESDVGSRYTPPEGLERLRCRLAERTNQRLGTSVDERWISVTAGASVGLTATILTVTQAGDAIACPDPGYPGYPPLIRRLERRPVSYRASDCDADLLSSIERCIDEGSRLVIWNSPANPVGWVADERMTEQVAQLAAATGVALLSDESYEEIVFEGRHTSPVTYAPDAVYGVFSLSKSFGLAGWRVGYVTAPPEQADRIAHTHFSVAMGAPTLGQYAALGALNADPSYHHRLLARLRESRDRASEILAELPHRMPHGTYFLWLDIAATGLSSEEFVAHCRAEQRVSLMPGSVCGPAGEGHVRLNFAAQPDDVLEGARRVRRFYRERTA
jgi:aspartate/methionine/tyrosine aminotransferase